MHVCRLHGNELNYGNAQIRKKTNAGYNFVLYIFTNIYFWPNVVFCVCVWGFLCVCKAYIYTSAKIPKTQILKKHLLLFVGSRDEGRKVQCTGGDHTHTHKHTHPHQRHNAGHRLCIGIGGLCENTAVCEWASCVDISVVLANWSLYGVLFGYSSFNIVVPKA